MNFKILICVFLVFLAGCSHSSRPAGTSTSEAGANGDAPESAIRAVRITAETVATLRDGAGDPAVWVNSGAPGESLILGSTAEGGIEVYNLRGERTQVIADRLVSLVDLHSNFPFAGEEINLVVAYDAATAELIAYELDVHGGTLEALPAAGLATEAEIEGLCLYLSPISNKLYAFAAGNGELQQWELYEDSGTVAGRKIRTVPVGLGAASCTVQDSAGALFYSQETVGVWMLNAEPESEAAPVPVDFAQPFGHFSGDAKGVAHIEYADGTGYLLALDSEASQVHAYELPGLDYAATIGFAGEIPVDGLDEPEGIAATGENLSESFPAGLVVISDEFNDDERSNYKLVSWNDIAGTYGLKTGGKRGTEADAKPVYITVTPSVETEPVTSYGDAADDPAIWVHPSQPELSLIIGTQKQSGVNVYDLSGNLVQSLPDGRVNNIDVRYGFSLDGKVVDVVTATNRSSDSLSIYGIDASTRTLYDLTDGIIDTGMVDPYGLCMYYSKSSGRYFVFVNDTSGVVRQWVLEDNGAGRISGRMVREFRLESQTEGCVADDDSGSLFVGEEDVGIWKYSAEPEGGDARTLLDSAVDGNLTADVEGMAIYQGVGGAGYLIVSNQGANNYAVYERTGDNRFLGLFFVVADATTGIDGSSETDGLEVTSANLGPAFPDGVLVVQDGRNITPEERQNFKLVPWERIAGAMGLQVQAGYDPRARRVE
jgi:3-phytase